jgi:DNA-binding MarR family transcriptional regulator
VTRLNPEPISAAEVHAVTTHADLHPSAKIIAMHLRAVAYPQRRKDLAEALGVDAQTVTRSLRALSEHGLVRQVSGLWVAEVQQ